jgi:hypothetical protein
MTKAEIYQIFYSPESRAVLDPGFLPLDNLANERPDWREYWPIRKFLLSHDLQPDVHYGFFSAKFGAKTGLEAASVRGLVERHGAEADVVAFSPFFQHIALFLNVIEQGVACHGLADTFLQCAQLIAPGFQVDQSVMSSVDTIYSNFFVAGREFWIEWLRHAERLFAIAEEGSTPLAQALNAIVPYRVRPINAAPGNGHGQTAAPAHSVPGVPAKVFVIERLASLLLWSNPRWRVLSFSRPSLTTSPDLIVLDALKIAYAQSGAAPYLETFRKLRPGMLSRHLPEVCLAPATSAASGGPSPAKAGAVPVVLGAAPAEKIRVICASRSLPEEFATRTMLGQSSALRVAPQVELRLFPDNREGLARVYNIAIDECRNEPAILVFVHDDVYLSDASWAERLREGLQRFDVLGVVGNRRRLARQPSWFFSAFDREREVLTKDDRENFSGTVNYGRGSQPEQVNAYGPAGQEVKLLDGLFLAARSVTLHERSLRFDERFTFHFYDLDFCRQAERAGLTLGTWPISVIHGSAGSFGGDGWRRGYDRYIEKWGD